MPRLWEAILHSVVPTQSLQRPGDSPMEQCPLLCQALLTKASELSSAQQV